MYLELIIITSRNIIAFRHFRNTLYHTGKLSCNIPIKPPEFHTTKYHKTLIQFFCIKHCYILLNVSPTFKTLESFKYRSRRQTDACSQFFSGKSCVFLQCTKYLQICFIQCIHSAKITALGETEVSVRNPEKYPYADIEWDDGGNSGCLLKNLYASREELQKELKKEEENKIAEIKAKIKDASDLVAFMYDHCVACAEEYTDWTARKAVKEIAKEMLGLDLD